MPRKGDKAGHPCIFPFTHIGKTCPGPKCCNLNNLPEGPWCSTKNDANGVHVRGNYALCEGSPCDPGIPRVKTLENFCTRLTKINEDKQIDRD